MMKYSLLSIILFLPFYLAAQSYDNVESVEYDANENRFLVSNGNSILARASDGTLSFFGSGSASYGMEVMNGNLFAIKGSQVRGYDLTSTEEVMSITLSGAQFLNGLANDGNNRLWATDFNGNRIYEIDVTDMANPTSSVVVSNTGSTPNGIYHDAPNNRLLFVSWGSNASIKAVDLTDYSVSTVLNTSVGNIDGIDTDSEGNFYISHWTPAGITRYDSDLSNPQVVVVPGIANPADICYAQEIDSLAIPNNGSDVLFVGFDNSTSLEGIIDEQYQLSFGPNPITTASSLTFQLDNREHIRIGIYNVEGKLMQSLLDHELDAGRYNVLLSEIQLSNGVYFLRMKTENGIIQRKMVVR